MGHILRVEALGGYNAIDLDNAIEIVARYGRRLTRDMADPEAMRKLAQLGEVCLSVSRRLSKFETSREKPEEREYMAKLRVCKPLMRPVTLNIQQLIGRVDITTPRDAAEMDLRGFREMLIEEISDAVTKALLMASDQMHETLKAPEHRLFISGTDTLAEPSQAGPRSQYSRKPDSAPRQKLDQGAFGTPYDKLLNAVKSGNIQDQLTMLAELETLIKKRRRGMDIRPLSRNQYLEDVLRFLKSQGLSIDTQVLRQYRCSSQHSSVAKV